MKPSILAPAHFPWFDYRRYSFSLGVAAGEFAYLSGHTASTYDPGARRIVVPDGMSRQAHTAYDKIEAILAAGGKTLADVVRLVEYVTPDGIDRYAEAAAVRQERFGAHLPAVNTVPVKALLRPDALIEIEAMAGPAGPAGGSAPNGAVESGGLVFLPSLAAPEAGGDVAAQTEAIFDKASDMLGAMELSLGHLARTVEFVAPAALAEYRTTARVRRDRLGPVFPAATGIVMPRLVRPDALVQIDMIASRAPPAAIDMGWPRYARLTYSPAVRAGRHLFLSGQGAIDPLTGEMLAAGDVVGQADVIYRNILAILAAAGAGPGNLVKTVEYTTAEALTNYRAVADVRKALLAEPYPASTGPVCEAMVRPEMLIEVDATAVLDQA
jgi:enamine deaminase RidA (YjgF/YER057c/UK114 family)